MKDKKKKKRQGEGKLPRRFVIVGGFFLMASLFGVYVLITELFNLSAAMISGIIGIVVLSASLAYCILTGGVNR
jgi:hypothetical protein